MASVPAPKGRGDTYDFSVRNFPVSIQGFTPPGHVRAPGPPETGLVTAALRMKYVGIFEDRTMHKPDASLGPSASELISNRIADLGAFRCAFRVTAPASDRAPVKLALPFLTQASVSAAL